MTVWAAGNLPSACSRKPEPGRQTSGFNHKPINRGDFEMKKSMLWIAGLMLLLFAWTNTSLAADRMASSICRRSFRIQRRQKAAEDFKSFCQQESIKTMENEVKKLQDELDKQGADRRARRQNRLPAQDARLPDPGRRHQQGLRSATGITQQLIPNPEVVDHSRKEKYTLILDVSTMPRLFRQGRRHQRSH